MRNKMNMLWKLLGNVVCAVAVFSIYLGHPHCLLIIHQPKVPEELKNVKREKIHENFDLR